MAITVADGAWIAASGLILITFWTQMTPIALFLIVATALGVEVFATLDYRAARPS